MTLKMNDLFEREKYGHLPRKLSTDASHTHEYALGDIAFWPPEPDVAVFYRHDGEAIPNPGIIVLGRVTSGPEALRGRDPLKVKFELIERSTPSRRVDSTGSQRRGDNHARSSPLRSARYSL
jgi:hypothetical protein